MSDKKTFEENLQELETIVSRLETGDVALEDAIAEFQKGMLISKELQKTLKEAEETLVKVMQADGTEVEMDT
ncbi:TPA: exodeoxyribonuclease VII small subunit [Streptococcus agalactiae]|uniref:Exodeoxyribonuclease 7 small subunit n=1 Tax=Streptococcus agalactiae TaxID=1311 RepID=R4ZBW1_STRAG|nr:MULTISPECIES: exodeoxyribonuclease VII small subunit [Streptococcus]AHN30110.1 exodeoxyribonuclease VII small subunit [Streptococcus agalactiae 138P]EJZ04044.1 exodeoxyribonuclease VII small subunit [Streptococcus agalactiae STIR-CD-17]EPU02274.1 exodeoxyribonuclease VII small subunit [Streptococcus agalactiae STIR-CD-13]EPU03699.1 exodeoxyribonuclease VII small subunit [Streptococcus agalactiae STIR-CD-09]EPU36943.1 exodeoxyribonuclease VII small subunit [Streptococcus agalactiae MRI Z1-03